MGLSTFAGRAVGSSAALLFLAGCSVASVTPSDSSAALMNSSVARTASSLVQLDPAGLGVPAGLKSTFHATGVTRAGWLSPQAPKVAKVYVSDYGGNSVVIYAASTLGGHSPIGMITSGINAPLGSFVNSIGTLFVTNYGFHTITEYKKNTNTPSKTLKTKAAISVVEAANGTVYASEFAHNNVDVYKNGATSPTSHLSVLGPEGLSIDTQGNLFVAYYNSEAQFGGVVEFKVGSTVGMDLGIVIGSGGGIKIDKANNVALGDQINDVINIYPPGQTTPSRSISTGSGDPYAFALNKPETTLYCADPNSETVLIYNYANGAQTGAYTGLTSVGGVSVSPDMPY
jgi:hypothetical protein